jgi:hypothetical protein
MANPKCPACGNETISPLYLEIFDEDSLRTIDFSLDRVAFCSDCALGITRDDVLLKRVADGEGNTVSAGVGKGERIIFVAGRFDSDRNVAILCELEEEAAKFRRQGDLSSTEARQAIWNAKRAKRRFRFWQQEKGEPLLIKDERKRVLVEKILEEGPGKEPDVGEILDELLSPNHLLVQRAVDYEITRRAEPILVLADFPAPLRKLFDELIDAHRWGLNRAAVALCRLLLQEMVELAVERTGVTVVPKERESRLVAELNVLHDSQILSDKEYAAANEIKNNGNSAVHDISAEVSAWQTIELTVELLRRLANRGLLSYPS